MLASKEEINAWKEHPITKIVLTKLTAELDYLQRQTLQGSLMQDNKLEFNYGHVVGRIFIIGSLLSDKIFEGEEDTNDDD